MCGQSSRRGRSNRCEMRYSGSRGVEKRTSDSRRPDPGRSRSCQADTPFRNTRSPERCDLIRGNPRNKKAQPNLFRQKSLPLGLAGRHQQAAVLDGGESHRQNAPTDEFYPDHDFSPRTPGSSLIVTIGAPWGPGCVSRHKNADSAPGRPQIAPAGPGSIGHHQGPPSARKSPAPEVRGRIDQWRAAVRGRPAIFYIWVISRSLVSGRKMSPTTKLIAATTIGYQSPE